MASRIVATLGVAALLSVLPTPLRPLMHGVFGGAGVDGPVTAATVVGFWSVGLLMTARGLRHGHRLAYVLTLTFIGVAAGLHLVHHNDLVETALLGLVVAWLLGWNRAFTVRASHATTAKAMALTGGAAGVGATALGVIVELTRHHLLNDSDAIGMWDARQWLGTAATPLSFGGGIVPTVVLGVTVVLLVGTLWMILSPRAAEPETDTMHRVQRERARRIVTAHGRGTLDYFALRDDKRWFFYADSVVSYAVRFGVCLVSPDPIGPVNERRLVWTAFMEHARSHGWSVSILGASADWIDLYRSFGLHPVYLGDEAVVDCQAFSLEGRRMRNPRQACNRLDRAGYTVSFHDPIELDADTRRELLELSTMSRAGVDERGFSMTLSRIFDDQDVGLLLSISSDPQGRARAFIQWIPAPGINGWSLDVMRYDTAPDVPNGVMDHLIVQTIAHLQSKGEVGLALNFAVVRNLVTTEPSTTPGRLGQHLLEGLSGRTKLASLCQFNMKFFPDWQPRYVVLSSLDTMACQGLMIATAEGLSDLPVIGRFMKGVSRW